MKFIACKFTNAEDYWEYSMGLTPGNLFINFFIWTVGLVWGDVESEYD